MFINAKSIVYTLLLNIIVIRALEDKEQSENVINHSVTVNTDKSICECLNNGECYSPLTEDKSVNKKKEVYCRCRAPYIGEHCQFQGFELFNSKEISQKINIHDYKYFYFEPIEENMYSFSFDLCFDNKSPSKINYEKTTDDQISFFLTSENEFGGFETDEDITKAATVTFEPDECKQISIDYTVLLITKLKTIQKLIFAIKLGEKLKVDETKIDKELEREKENIKTVEKEIKKREPSEKEETESLINKVNDTSLLQNSDIETIKEDVLSDYHPISYNIYSQKKKSSSLKEEESTKKENSKNINEFKSKSPSKLKENDDSYTSKSLTISFSAYPFMVEFVVFNILFSLTTLVAFIIVGIIIFIVRGRILGITISTTLGISSRLINDLKHFDRQLPEEKYIKKERKEGDISPNSSEIECAICLVKFEEMDSIRKTPCSHSFHKSCIDSWCHENLTCPMCRKSLTEKNLMEYYNSTALELKNSPESDE